MANNQIRNQPIDFVITWVDGADEEWLTKKQKYKNGIDLKSEINRYRDWGLLKYWFRSVEEYAPWVNKIYFVTDNQIPKWLNVNNPKIVLVKHENYIDKKYLPLFNSNAIECTMNKIKGLSEQFVLFNDDMFIIKKTKPIHFFKNNKPTDQLIEDPIKTITGDEIFPHTMLNNAILVEDYNNKKEIIKKHPIKIFNIKYGRYLVKAIMNIPNPKFVGFRNPHAPQSFHKKSFEHLQKNNWSKFETTLSNRFRSKNDITQYAVRNYQLLTLDFAPRSNRYSEYYNITNDNIETIAKHIAKSKTYTICINDSSLDINYEKCRRAIIKAFEKKFPNKSSYEK